MLDSDAFVGTWDFKKKEVGIYKTISRARNRISDLQVQATFLTLSGLFEPMVAVRHLIGHRYRILHCSLIHITRLSVRQHTTCSSTTTSGVALRLARRWRGDLVAQ
jgi:hypothetical protein